METSKSVDALRVLVVEDHTLVRQMIADRLGKETDIEVVGQARDGESAIELAKQLEPDVIIMDVSLPGMNGIAATHHITLSLPQVRVIVLSLYEKEVLEEAMLEAGAVQFLNKAASFDELLAAIRTCAHHTGDAS